MSRNQQWEIPHCRWWWVRLFGIPTHSAAYGYRTGRCRYIVLCRYWLEREGFVSGCLSFLFGRARGGNTSKTKQHRSQRGETWTPQDGFVPWHCTQPATLGPTPIMISTCRGPSIRHPSNLLCRLHTPLGIFSRHHGLLPRGQRFNLSGHNRLTRLIPL